MYLAALARPRMILVRAGVNVRNSLALFRVTPNIYSSTKEPFLHTNSFCFNPYAFCRRDEIAAAAVVRQSMYTNDVLLYRVLTVCTGIRIHVLRSTLYNLSKCFSVNCWKGNTPIAGRFFFSRCFVG